MPARPVSRNHQPWNKGLLIGQKKPLEPKHTSGQFECGWKSRYPNVILQSSTWQSTANFVPVTWSSCESTIFAWETMFGIEQRSFKRRQVDQSNLRSRSSREVRLKLAYQRFGRAAPDIYSQVDFMPALIYQRANIPGWYTAGSRALAWRRLLTARTLCSARKLPRFIERPATCALFSFSSVIRSLRVPSDISGLKWTTL
jgi:hypothetical protein